MEDNKRNRKSRAIFCNLLLTETAASAGHSKPRPAAQLHRLELLVGIVYHHGAMWRSIIIRAALALPTLAGVTMVTFLLMQALPGDPVQSMAGERASAETIERIRAELGADKPVVIQYAGYLNLLLHGELGRSYFTNQQVGRELLRKFPNTLLLAAAAILFATVGGIGLGILSALKRGTFWDRLASVVAVCGISVPVFWLGLALMLVFALHLRWLPPSGMVRGDLSYLILPAVTLGTFSLAYIARVTRSSMLETLSQPYIAAARAKGLNQRTIVLKHALRNSLVPVVTLIGLDLGSYLNGAVLTETVFGWDGLGRYALDGILRRDYPVIMGVVLFGALVFVAMNLMVDLSYHVLDPRVRVRRER